MSIENWRNDTDSGKSKKSIPITHRPPQNLIPTDVGSKLRNILGAAEADERVEISLHSFIDSATRWR